ncbi:MAG: hypothetical protein QW412_00310 [Candidatus Aenigmatarchaeota archaeon]
MEIKEVFGNAVNASHESLENALEALGLSRERLEDNLKKKNFLLQNKVFDIIIDFKPELKQIVLYLTPKKWSKSLLKSLRKNYEFKSMVVLLGSTKILKKDFEIRLGAFGVSSSDLVRAVVKQK